VTQDPKDPQELVREAEAIEDKVAPGREAGGEDPPTEESASD
jgi:hypothetical protein